MNTITNIIVDSTCIVDPDDITILEQQDVSSNGSSSQPISKVIFKTKLQTAEEKNQNSRYYTRDILQEIVDLLKPKAKARALFQEIDHPFTPVSDPFLAKKRAITVQLKNCGSLIRDIYLDGNDVIGEVETLSGFKGPDLARILLYDKAQIGFSVRMFGRIVNKDGVNYVERPIKPITYDVVTNPSHKSATILEFLPEDVSNLTSLLPQETTMITEACSCITCDNVNPMSSIQEALEFLNTIVEDAYSSTRLVRFSF